MIQGPVITKTTTTTTSKKSKDPFSSFMRGIEKEVAKFDKSTDPNKDRNRKISSSQAQRTSPPHLSFLSPRPSLQPRPRPLLGPVLLSDDQDNGEEGRPLRRQEGNDDHDDHDPASRVRLVESSFEGSHPARQDLNQLSDEMAAMFFGKSQPKTTTTTTTSSSSSPPPPIPARPNETLSTSSSSTRIDKPRAVEPRVVSPRTVEPRTAQPAAASPRAAQPQPASPRAVPAQPQPASPRAPDPKPVSPRPAQPQQAASPRPDAPLPAYLQFVLLPLSHLLLLILIPFRPIAKPGLLQSMPPLDKDRYDALECETMLGYTKWHLQNILASAQAIRDHGLELTADQQQIVMRRVLAHAKELKLVCLLLARIDTRLTSTAQKQDALAEEIKQFVDLAVKFIQTCQKISAGRDAPPSPTDLVAPNPLQCHPR